MPEVTSVWSSALSLWTRWLKLLPASSMADFLTSSPTKHRIVPKVVTRKSDFKVGRKDSQSACSNQEITIATPYCTEWFT